MNRQIIGGQTKCARMYSVLLQYRSAACLINEAQYVFAGGPGWRRHCVD